MLASVAIRASRRAYQEVARVFDDRDLASGRWRRTTRGLFTRLADIWRHDHDAAGDADRFKPIKPIFYRQ
jgi:hypothetical protein